MYVNTRKLLLHTFVYIGPVKKFQVKVWLFVCVLIGHNTETSVFHDVQCKQREFRQMLLCIVFNACLFLTINFHLKNS